MNIWERGMRVFLKQAVNRTHFPEIKLSKTKQLLFKSLDGMLFLREKLLIVMN